MIAETLQRPVDLYARPSQGLAGTKPIMEMIVRLPATMTDRHEIHSVIAQIMGAEQARDYIYGEIEDASGPPEDAADRDRTLWMIRGPRLPRGVVGTEAVLPQETGEMVDFTLRASPMIGKKPIEDVSEHGAWLERQARANGLWLLKPIAVAAVVRTVRDDAMRSRVRTFTESTFSGRALITDPDLVAAAVRRGIGRNKCYGQGLLRLFRP